MSIYDVLMTAVLIALGLLLVVNHRTGWLASRVMEAPRRQERLPGHESPRMLLGSEEAQSDLAPSSPSSRESSRIR